MKKMTDEEMVKEIEEYILDIKIPLYYEIISEINKVDSKIF